MQDFEKLGVFYLGKKVDPATGKTTKDLLLYDSADMTTHAVCVGMTGSGKTGLGIAILEEAAIDKIPAIIIDPKGDLGDLLLTFPNLSPEEFKPWIDEAAAEKKGMDADAYSSYIAKFWSDGLASWGENADRIKNLRSSVELAIYTPASNAGIPISILSSFAAPSKEQMSDTGAVREKILSTTSSLLGLLKLDADPIQSREHILISTLIQQAWQEGKDVSIATLIQLIQKPPFAKIGALDLETFYPTKERIALSISLNNLLASPGFQAWMEGEPLEIKRLLYTDKGKPKLSVIYIAHLSDAERMFFVTLLLNEFVSWMRSQSGTSSLRAILYMDEIFGFFPPTAMPPSKIPMLTLLKQARAFGVGVILATQNPVDLDYKGLANCGTWFIGKLQTERDKARVLEGLKVASNGEMNTSTLDEMLALTGNRNFIMRSIHEKDPILFQTRWTLSYLRGPLTLAQIASLTDKSRDSGQVGITPSGIQRQNNDAASHVKANVPPGVEELYFQDTRTTGQPVHYEPRLIGMAKLHFVDTKNKIDSWKDFCLVAPVNGDDKNMQWEEPTTVSNLKNLLEKEPAPESTFAELPSILMQEKNYPSFAKGLTAALYQNQTLTVFQTTNPPMTSSSDESEGDFRVRISHDMREKRDEGVKKLRDKYAGKIKTLSDKVQRSQEKVTARQQKAWMQKIQTLINFGTTLLGALFGRGVTKGTISQSGTTLRHASKIGSDSQSASQAEEEVAGYQQQLQDLEAEMNDEIAALTAKNDAESIPIQTISIHPRKSDITVEKVAVVWWSI